MSGNHPVFAVLLLLLLAALVALGVLAVVRMWGEPGGRTSERPSPPGPMDDPAFTELRMRYARGEIDWDDYMQRAATLGYPMWSGPGPTGPPPGSPGPPSGGA